MVFFVATTPKYNSYMYTEKFFELIVGVVFSFLAQGLILSTVYRVIVK